MKKNPYDPRKRTNLTENEQRALRFMTECLHGDNFDLIDEYVAEDYIQHTPGIGQGREGLRHYLKEVASRRPGRYEWRPIHLFSDGDFVKTMSWPSIGMWFSGFPSPTMILWHSPLKI
jgi:predicted SnoaL-like aldol condensation-catalyzing enzyme